MPQVECIPDGQILDTTVVHDESSIDSDNEQDIPISKQDKSLITDVDSNAWESLMQQMSAQQELIGMLKSELKVVVSPAAKKKVMMNRHIFTPGYHLMLCSHHC